MRASLRIFAVLTCLFVLAGNARAAGHVYLIKGAFGIFSTGLITLGDELRARGYNVTVVETTEVPAATFEAVQLQKSGRGPIVIVGHSIGANAAISMADTMKEDGASVALIVGLGPTYDMVVPSNVARVVNFYQANGVVAGRAFRGSGFRGSIANINLDSREELNHFNIDKNEQLHARVIGIIRSALAQGSRSPKRFVKKHR